MPIVWSEQLSALLDLQKIDSRIFVLERELAEKPAQKRDLETVFEAKKSQMKASENALKAMQMKQKDRENDLASKETNIKKYMAQQSLVKTNQEYSALTKEINGQKADCSIFEEDILKLMDEIEQQKSIVEADRQKVAGIEKECKAQLATIDARCDAIKTEIAGLQAERAKFVPAVEKTLLPQYERILKKKDGVALVPLSGESCSGCHMSVRAQTVTEIRMKDKMIACEVCGRILYDA